MRYDMTQTYEWNYGHSPEVPSASAALDAEPMSSRWAYCGMPVEYPLGVAAGPLLNGKWVLHYANQGFSVLTYKTVRSRARACYPLPNLQWIGEGQVSSGQRVNATDTPTESWAISFGMPSMEPKIWRADVEWTRTKLASAQVLAVSVVASPEPHWTEVEIAEDYATCAEWAFEAGADVVELNLSCPNVVSADGQLYRSPESTANVLDAVRARVGSKPIAIKIGFIESLEAISQLLKSCAGRCQGIVMTNCLSCMVDDEDGPVFAGEPRGIGGQAIRGPSVQQVAAFSETLRQLAITDIDLVGVGGISNAKDASEYFEAGASSVQAATAAMRIDDLGFELQTALADK